MPDQKFEEKWQNLQEYVPFLQKLINNLKRTMKDRPRPIQLEKMEMLFELLTKRDKTKLKYETLIKCETLLNKIYSKIEKTPKKIVLPTEVAEILEPESPPSYCNNIEDYRPPIEIPTERRESPEPIPSPQIPKKAEVIISNELSLEELLKQRELLESKIFNCNQNSNSNNSNDVTNNIETNAELQNEQKSNKNPSRAEPSSSEKIVFASTSKQIKNCHDSNTFPSKISKETRWDHSGTFRKSSFAGPSRVSPKVYCKDDFSEKQQHKLSPNDNDINFEKGKHYDKPHMSYNKYERTHSGSQHRIEQQTVKSAKTNVFDKSSQRRSTTPDWDAEIEEEEKLKNRINDSSIDKPWELNSPLRLDHDRNKQNKFHNNVFGDRNKMKNRLEKCDFSSDKSRDISSSLPKLTPPPSLTSFSKYLDEIQNSDSRSLSPLDLLSDACKSSNRSNEKLKLDDTKSLYQKEKVKTPIQKHFAENQKNSTPIGLTSIKDVLKSPPLSANDIDDLLHESASENVQVPSQTDNSTLHEVRKKLAKISTKLNQSSTSDAKAKGPDMKSCEKDTFVSSSESALSDRLALKYHPHVKKTSNNESNSQKSRIERLSPISQISKQNNSSNAISNVFPTVKMNDPRLKNKPQSQEISLINELFNISNKNDLSKQQTSINYGQSNVTSAIPSLLSNIIPPPTMDNFVQPNIKMSFPPNLIEIPLIGPSVQNTSSIHQQHGQPIPVVTIPKSTFSDFLNKTQIQNNSNISLIGNNHQIGYNKINPLQNDNFERQKYLESKKLKTATEDVFCTNIMKVQNSQPKTYGEYKRQCQLGKNLTTRYDQQKQSDNTHPNNTSIEKNKSIETISVSNDNVEETDTPNLQNKETNLNLISKDSRQVTKRTDPRIESSEKQVKHSSSEAQNTKPTISNSPNSSLKGPSIAVNDNTSISKFKIPKKCKDEVDDTKTEKNKEKVTTQEEDIGSDNENVNEDSDELQSVAVDDKEENKLDNDEHKTETNRKAETTLESSKSSLKRKRKFIPLKTDETKSTQPKIVKRRKSMVSSNEASNELSEINIQPNVENLANRRKSMPSLSLIVSEKSTTKEIMNTSLNYLDESLDEKIIRENITPKDDNDSLKSFDTTTDSASISSYQGGISKQNSNKKQKKLHYYYEIAPQPIDNSVLSVENIIEGKRRSRTAVNMNENALAPPKYLSKTKGHNTSECSSTPDSNKEEHSHFTIDKISQPDLQDSDVISTASNIEDTKSNISLKQLAENCNKINSEFLELTKITDPKSKKVKLLGVLSAVCDEEKLEKIRAILEEDDKLEQQKGKDMNLKVKNEMRQANENDKEVNSEGNSAKLENKSENCNIKSDKKSKHKTELDRLNEDIRDMFISQGVLSAYRKRVAAQTSSKEESSTSNLVVKDTSSKSEQNIFKLKDIKIKLKKLKVNVSGHGSVTLKNKTNPRRKRGCAWARGFITKKKTTSSISNLNKAGNKYKKTFSNKKSNKKDKTQMNHWEIIKEAYFDKPCPKSKKKSSKNENIVTEVIQKDLITELKPFTPNTKSEMHAKSEYTKKCFLCDKSLKKNLVLHYVEKHPEHEVLVSRLPPDTLEDLCLDRNNSALYQYLIKARNLMFHYRCPFCDIQQTASRSVWLDHFLTHTGEYRYKCSGCNKHSNTRNFIHRHIKMKCIGSQLIVKDHPPLNKNNIFGYICNACNYIQLVQTNIIEHISKQHDSENKKSKVKIYNRIVLMNMQNVPNVDVPPEEETKIMEEDNYYESDEDLEVKGQNSSNIKDIRNEMDVFLPKEQSDIHLDNSLLNYMNEVSFNMQNSVINERTSKSIVDELSERLKTKDAEKSSESIVHLRNETNENEIKEKSISIVDLLSQRFQNISEAKDIEILDPQFSVTKENQSNNENNTSDSTSKSILPLKTSDLNKVPDVCDKITNSQSAQLSLTETNEKLNDPIYVKLNEKLKNFKQVPNKKEAINSCETNGKNNKNAAITIIDRLNKRLKETTTKSVDKNLLSNESEDNAKNSKQSKNLTPTRVDCDSQDDNLITKDISNELEKTKEKSKHDKTNLEEKTPISTNSNILDDSIQVIEDDDDCWEDIETLSPEKSASQETGNSFSVENKVNDKSIKEGEQNARSKDKSKTILKTLSKLYVSFGKNKHKLSNKSIIDKTPALSEELVGNESSDSNLENSSQSKLSSRNQSSPLSDLMSDTAIPSPISTELITDPPFPLQSEPLSDLNDISEILEPSSAAEVTGLNTSTTNNINTIKTTKLNESASKQNLSTNKNETINTTETNPPVNINDINEPILFLPENATIEEALALAAEIEKTKIVYDVKADEDAKSILSAPATVTIRINNLGFSESNGKIKYLCLIPSCPFLFSYQEIGLQNHYNSDHKDVCWEGYCYSCEANICSEDDLPLDRELKHMKEVHIKNVLKQQSILIENALNQNSDSNKSFEEVLMANRPKIKIRRLSGDLLSKSEPKIIESSTRNNLDTILLTQNNQVSSDTISNQQATTSCVAALTASEIVSEKTSKQNLLIKELLSSPSLPPPLINISSEESSKSKSVNTIQIQNQNLQVKTYSRQISKLNTPLFNADKPLKVVIQSKNQMVGPIKNNMKSGSGLKISSVCEGVSVAEKEFQINATKILPKTIRADQLKIVSVAGGIKKIQNDLSKKPPNIPANITLIPIKKSAKTVEQKQSTLMIPSYNSEQLQLSEEQNILQKVVSTAAAITTVSKPLQTQTQTNNVSGFLRIENVCSLGAKIMVTELNSCTTNTTSPSSVKLNEISNFKKQKSVTCTLSGPSSTESVLSDSLISSSSTPNSSVLKLIKPWIYPTVSKPTNIAQYQLRAISLYAIYKCMNLQCFFTTNSSDNILEHFKNHEKKNMLSNLTSIEANNFDWLRCSYCNFVASNSVNYVEHINSVHIHDIFQCPYCFYRSCNDFNVQKHIEEYHHDVKMKIFVCHGERKRLASEMKFLAIYRAKFIKPIPCFDCNKKFFILRNYLRHLNDHNINNDCYTCGMCNSKGLLKKCADTHLSLVHRISVYQCIYCDMSSSLRSIMITHMAKDHPSHLLYSCVRVSPNKNVTFAAETIENSTVLANLNETVSPQYLQNCNFTVEHINFMNPSLDHYAIEQNKFVKIFKNTSIQEVASIGNRTPLIISSVTSLANQSPSLTIQQHSVSNRDSQASNFVTNNSKELSISALKDVSENILSLSSQNINSVQMETDAARETVIVENNFNVNQIISDTDPLGSIQDNSTELSEEQSSSVIRKITETITIDDDSDAEDTIKSNSSSKIVEKSQNDQEVTKNIDDILKSCTELTKNCALKLERIEKRDGKISSTYHLSNINNKLKFSKTAPDSADFNRRIIEAAKEYVLDTGYEGSDLYRCSQPECFNLKLNCNNLSLHYSQVHPRLKQFKCPHCTCQYNNFRSLNRHLSSHKLHRYFCYFCNHTTSMQSHLNKHYSEFHPNSGPLLSFPLPTSAKNLDNKYELSFFVIASATTNKTEILQFGERLIRTCERKRSLAKRSYNPNEIDQLPFQAIFNAEVACSLCSYRTKVRTNMYRHLLFHKTEVKVASTDPVNPVPCLVSNEKNFDKMINMALSSNLNKENNDKIQTIASDSEVVNIGSQQLCEIQPDTGRNDIISNSKTLEHKIPDFIPVLRRFICGVPNCTYLTIADNMLKCHLQTLHKEEKNYKCPHCDVDIIVKQNFCPEKILQHLKLHDSKIFMCSECNYVHFLKYVVVRHINDRHSTSTHVEIHHYFRTEVETKITKESILSSATTSRTSLGNKNNSDVICEINDENPEVTTNNDLNKESISGKKSPEQLNWSCTTCKFQTINEPTILQHINAEHNIRFRYGCFFCKFGAVQINLVKEHISEKHHNFQQRQVKSNYYRLDESDNDIVQENRPLWTRSDPYRIKHIRGILMEDERTANKSSKSISENKKLKLSKKSLSSNSLTNDSSNASLNTTKKKIIDKNVANNTLIIPENISNTSKIINTNEKNSNQESINNVESENVIANQSDEISLKTNENIQPKNVVSETSEKNEEIALVESSTSNLNNLSDPDALERSIEIYECYYCPMKNISFKVVYTHWLLHHCKKVNSKTVENISDETDINSGNINKTEFPLLAKPFAFKVVGYIGANSLEVFTYNVTINQFNRLQKIGQRVTRFQCNKCWRLFANSISVTQHQKHEHASTATHNHRCLTFKNRLFFICSSCGYASSLECKTAAHLLNHYEGLKKCSICNRTFSKFLDFIRHLPDHNSTFKEFIQKDKNIREFWNKIIVLFPNGLCMMRSHIPASSGVILDDLLDIVSKEVESALKQAVAKPIIPVKPEISTKIIPAKKIYNDIQEETPSVKKSKANDVINLTDEINESKSRSNENEINTANENTTVANLCEENVPVSEQLSKKNIKGMNSLKRKISSTDKSLLVEINSSVEEHRFKESSTEIVFTKEDFLRMKGGKMKAKKKYKNDSEWLPKQSRKRKLSSNSSGSFNRDEDDDDNLPLSTVLRKQIIPQNEKKLMPIIGPKFTQKKFRNSVTPYSYYGNKPQYENLNELLIKLNLDENDPDDSILITCQKYSEIIPIDCCVVVEKLNPEILKSNSINLLKRKIDSQNV